MNEKLKIIACCTATALVVGATSATAASLITGKDVKNNNLTGANIKNIRTGDIKNGTIRLRDLSSEVRAALAQAGPIGPAGAPGSTAPTPRCPAGTGA